MIKIQNNVDFTFRKGANGATHDVIVSKTIPFELIEGFPQELLFRFYNVSAERTARGFELRLPKWKVWSLAEGKIARQLGQMPFVSYFTLTDAEGVEGPFIGLVTGMLIHQLTVGDLPPNQFD